MNARDGLQELKNVSKRFAKLVIDVNFLATENAITWANYLPGTQNHVNYLYEYRSIIDYRQFSILLQDGGALQFYYRFGNGELVASRQCYYPPPFDQIDEGRDIDFEISLDDLFSAQLQGEGDEPQHPIPYRARYWSHIR